MNSTKDLIERLESGDGPDRKLENDLWIALHPDMDVKTAGWAPDYTNSLDSCRHLQETMLPGWVRISTVTSNMTEIGLASRIDEIVLPDDYGNHIDECRAWLIAILKAAEVGS